MNHRMLLCVPVMLISIGCKPEGKKETAPESSGNAAVTAPAGEGASANPLASVRPTALVGSGASPAAALAHTPIAGVGPVRVLFESARTLPVSQAEKEQIAVAASRLGSPMDPYGETQRLQDELVDGINKGKIDMERVEAREAAYAKALKDQDANELEVLGTLHGMTDTSQRNTILAKAMKIHKAPPPPPSLPPQGDVKSQVARLTTLLDLTEAQQTKAKEALAKHPFKITAPDPTESEKNWEAVLDEFRKPKFEAKGVVLQHQNPLTPLVDQARVMALLVPTLTPAQRTKWATMLAGRPDAGAAPAPPKPANP